MTTMTLIPSRPGFFAAGSERSAPTWLDGLRRAWTEYRTYRRGYAELRKLDERLIEDLGILPGDRKAAAHQAVYGN